MHRHAVVFGREAEEKLPQLIQQYGGSGCWYTLAEAVPVVLDCSTR